MPDVSGARRSASRDHVVYRYVPACSDRKLVGPDQPQPRPHRNGSGCSGGAQKSLLRLLLHQSHLKSIAATEPILVVVDDILHRIIASDHHPRIGHVDGQPIYIIVGAVQKEIAPRRGPTNERQAWCHHPSLGLLIHPRIRHQSQCVGTETRHQVGDRNRSGIHRLKFVYIKWVVFDPCRHAGKVKTPNLHGACSHQA